MKTEQYDIKTNIKIGEQIFENVPNDLQPGWAGLILSRFNHYIKDIPTSVLELYSIIDNKELWKEAHQQFSKIRVFGLENKTFLPEYLRLAELVAKVTYNASGQPAPFDSDSGHHIPSIALKAAVHFDDIRLEEEIKSTILLFNRNKKIKDNLTVAKDFLLYKKIDDILWFDWDPIGVNGIAPRDEYQGYVAQIFGLVRAKADKYEIAARLYKFETDNMGMSSTIENCLTIADKVLKAQ